MEQFVMPRSRAFIVVASLGTVFSLHAHGQGLPDVKFLDGIAAQRNAAMRPRPEQPAPVATPHERLRPTGRLWTCMSTTPWQPILSSPYPTASIIGRTLPQIAAGNGWVNGYGEVLSYNGKIGFVPSSQIRPYHSELNANGTCTVAGLRALSTCLTEVQQF